MIAAVRASVSPVRPSAIPWSIAAPARSGTDTRATAHTSPATMPRTIRCGCAPTVSRMRRQPCLRVLAPSRCAASLRAAFCCLVSASSSTSIEAISATLTPPSGFFCALRRRVVFERLARLGFAQRVDDLFAHELGLFEQLVAQCDDEMAVIVEQHLHVGLCLREQLLDGGARVLVAEHLADDALR